MHSLRASRVRIRHVRFMEILHPQIRCKVLAALFERSQIIWSAWLGARALGDQVCVLIFRILGIPIPSVAVPLLLSLWTRPAYQKRLTTSRNYIGQYRDTDKGWRFEDSRWGCFKSAVGTNILLIQLPRDPKPYVQDP